MGSLSTAEVMIMLVMCAVVGTVLGVTISWFLKRLSKIEEDFWGTNANWENSRKAHDEPASSDENAEAKNTEE